MSEQPQIVIRLELTNKEFEYLKYMINDVLKFWKEANEIFSIEDDKLFEDKTPVEIMNNKNFIDKLKDIKLLEQNNE